MKGTTGTQASFLELFGGDHARVRRLDELVAAKLGFHSSYEVTGQTYTRKVDSQVVTALSGVSESCHKAGNDLRLAAAWGLSGMKPSCIGGGSLDLPRPA